MRLYPKYKLLSLAAQITGTVDMTAAGSAYIVPDEGGEDIFVSQANLNGALHGDKVKYCCLPVRSVASWRERSLR